MKEINITKYECINDIKRDLLDKSIENINGENYFPIDAIKLQSFCEYQIYLKYKKFIQTPKTSKKTHGSEIKNQIEDIFKEDADEMLFEDALEVSKKEALMSRQFFMYSYNYGIKGYADEIWMREDEIVLINEAQGRTPYDTTMNPIRASCLALSDMTDDGRTVKAALRERGTENLFWIEVFTPEVKENILNTVNRVHDLLSGNIEYQFDLKKCEGCEFKNYCDKRE